MSRNVVPDELRGLPWSLTKRSVLKRMDSKYPVSWCRAEESWTTNVCGPQGLVLAQRTLIEQFRLFGQLVVHFIQETINQKRKHIRAVSAYIFVHAGVLLFNPKDIFPCPFCKTHSSWWWPAVVGVFAYIFFCLSFRRWHAMNSSCLEGAHWTRDFIYCPIFIIFLCLHWKPS